MLHITVKNEFLKDRSQICIDRKKESKLFDICYIYNITLIKKHNLDINYTSHRRISILQYINLSIFLIFNLP